MLFNWFKKKDKLIPLDSVELGKEQVSPEPKPVAPGAQRKPPARPAKAAPGGPKTGDTSKIKTSESSIIRIGKLGEVLLQYNMVSREDLEKALEVQQQQPPGEKRKLLGEILIEKKLVTEEQLLSAFARHCRIPYFKINKYGLPKAAIQAVPADLVIKHKVLPVDKVGTVLMLAVTDPYNTAAVEEVTAKTNLKVKTILCKQSEFEEMVKFYYPHAEESTAEKPADSVPEIQPSQSQASPAPETQASQTPAPEPKDVGDPAGTAQGKLKETAPNEDTSVFKIEELPFPEPPASVRAKAEPVPAKEQAEVAPPPMPREKTEVNEPAVTEAPKSVAEKASDPQSHPVSEPPVPAEAAEKSAPESFLGGMIEEPARPKEEIAPAPEPPVQTAEITAPVAEEINAYDTSIIDIKDLLSSQKVLEDESVKIINEEAEDGETVDVTRYIYPEEKPAREPLQQPLPAQAETAKETSPVLPITPPKPESRPAEKEKETVPAAPPVEPVIVAAAAQSAPESAARTTAPENAMVMVSEDEFQIARQLFTTQLVSSWEKLYHRSNLSHAEKVDETEFALYTESAIL